MSRAFVNEDHARVELVPVGKPEDPAAFAARLDARLAAREINQPTEPFHR